MNVDSDNAGLSVPASNSSTWFHKRRFWTCLALAVFGFGCATIVTEVLITNENGVFKTGTVIPRLGLQGNNNKYNATTTAKPVSSTAMAGDATTDIAETFSSSFVPEEEEKSGNFDSYYYSFTSVVSIAATTYVATNMDNLTLLVGLLVQYHTSKLWVVLGYLLSMCTLCFLAFLIGEAADTIPIQYLGFLGLIPLSLGLYGLYQLVIVEKCSQQQQQDDNDSKTESDGLNHSDNNHNSIRDCEELSLLPSASSTSATALPRNNHNPPPLKMVLITTFVTQIGNGGDTIVTFGILFADSPKRRVDVMIFGTVAVMASIFCVGAVWGIRHPIVTRFADRYGPKLTPPLMIVLGSMVLLNTRSDIDDDGG